MITDELNGISDEKVGRVISELDVNRLVTEDKSDHYSLMHFSLS